MNGLVGSSFSAFCKRQVGLGRLVLLKQSNGVDVDAVHLHLAVGSIAGNLADWLADGGSLGGLVDDGIGTLRLRQAVVTLGAIGLAFELGNVAEVVQRERIVRDR